MTVLWEKEKLLGLASNCVMLSFTHHISLMIYNNIWSKKEVFLLLATFKV